LINRLKRERILIILRGSDRIFLSIVILCREIVEEKRQVI